MVVERASLRSDGSRHSTGLNTSKVYTRQATNDVEKYVEHSVQGARSVVPRIDGSPGPAPEYGVRYGDGEERWMRVRAR
jgi:hypothetical protein